VRASSRRDPQKSFFGDGAAHGLPQGTASSDYGSRPESSSVIPNVIPNSKSPFSSLPPSKEYPVAVRVPQKNGEDKVESNVPEPLATGLMNQLMSHISDPRRKQRWDSMKPTDECCILVNCIGKAIKGPPMKTACRTCAKKDGRPCALLAKIEDVTTVVFLPLEKSQRGSRNWDELGFWVSGQQV
jgi:hypothetical protein